MDKTTQISLVTGLNESENQSDFVKDFIQNNPEDKKDIKKVASCYERGEGLDACLQKVLKEDALQINASFFAGEESDYYVYESEYTLAEIQYMLSENPHDNFLRLLYVRAFIDSGELQGAKAHLADIEASLGETVNVIMLKGHIAYLDGDFDLAVECFEKVYESVPEQNMKLALLQAYDMQALVLALDNNKVAAVSVWQKMNELDPENIEVAMNLGRCYLLLGDKVSAINTFEAIATADQTNDEAYHLYQLATMMGDDIGFALDKRAVEKFPLWAEVNNAEVSFDKDKAVNFINNATDLISLLAMANEALKQDEFSYAVQALEKALDSDFAQEWNGVTADCLIKFWLAYTFLNWEETIWSTNDRMMLQDRLDIIKPAVDYLSNLVKKKSVSSDLLMIINEYKVEAVQRKEILTKALKTLNQAEGRKFKPKYDSTLPGIVISF